MPVPPHYQPNGGSNRPSSSGNNNNAAGGPPPYDSVPPSGGQPPPQPPPQQQQRLPVEKPAFVPQGQPASINDMNPNTPLYQLIETTKNDPEYNRDVTDSECSALLEFSLDAYFHAQQTRNGRMIIPDRQNIRNQIDQMYDIKQEPDSKMQMMQQQQQQQQQQARLAQQRQAAQMQQMQQQQRPQRPMHPQMQTVGSGGFQYVANPSTSSQYPPNWPPNGQGVPPQGNMHVRPMMQQQQMRHPGPYPVHVQQQQQQPAGRSPYYPGDQPGPSNGHPQHPPPGYPNQPIMSPAYSGGPPSAGPQSGGFSRQSSFQDPYGRQPASMVPPPQNMVKQEVLSRPGSSGESMAMKHSPADFNSPTAMTNGTPINTSGDMHGGMFSPKNGIRQQPQMMPPRNSPMMSPPVHMTKNGLMSPQVMGDAQQSPMQANGIEALRQGGPQNVSPLVAATPPNNNESPNCPKLLAALSKSGDGIPSMLPNGSPAGETLLAANPRKRASEDDKQKPKRAKIDTNNMPYRNMLQFLLLHLPNNRNLLRHICELLMESCKASKRALEWKDGQQRTFTVSKPRVFSDRWKNQLVDTEVKNVTYAKMEQELLRFASTIAIGGMPVIVKIKEATREFQFFPGFQESERLRQNQTSIAVDNTNRLVEYIPGSPQQMPMPQQHQMPQQPNHQMMYPGAPNGGVPPPNGGPNNANVRYMNMQPPQPPPQHFAPAPIKTA